MKYGHIKTSLWPKTFIGFMNKTEEFARSQKADMFAVERTFAGAAAIKSTKLVAMTEVLIEAFKRKGEVKVIGVSSWRKIVFGNGKTDKATVVKKVVKHFKIKKKMLADEAEAISIGLSAINYQIK